MQRLSVGTAAPGVICGNEVDAMTGFKVRHVVEGAYGHFECGSVGTEEFR